jgi:type IV pilus assembly protein PilX
VKPMPIRNVRARQQGAVLFVSLILLVILTLIGIAAARLQSGEAIMARNEHNHQLAMQTAEAALRNAETNVTNGVYTTPQFAQNSNGLYVLQSEVQGAGASSIADTISWSSPGTAAMTSSAPAAPSYAGPAVAAAQLIIESLPPVARAGDPLCTASYGAQQSCSVYRLTAHATGGDASASATLQSVIH